jgi:hypothetical protein
MNRSCTRINLQNSLRVSQESAEQSKVEAALISIVSSRRTTSKTASRQPTRVRTCTTQDGDIIEQPATPFIEKAEMQGILPSRRSTTVRVSRQPTEVLPTDDDLYKVPPPVPPRAATRVSRQPTRVPTAVGETVEAGEPAPAPRRATTRISKKPTPSLTTSEDTFESCQPSTVTRLRMFPRRRRLFYRHHNPRNLMSGPSQGLPRNLEATQVSRQVTDFYLAAQPQESPESDTADANVEKREEQLPDFISRQPTETISRQPTRSKPPSRRETAAASPH